MTSDEAAATGDGGMAGRTGPPFDTSIAHQARVYDYLLGGKDNYAADRAAAEAALKAWPDMAAGARANRALLGRMIRYLAGEAGIRQFLDIGTGIPTAGNTHQVAQAIAPESRVVYVDYDPIVLARARALLASNQHLLGQERLQGVEDAWRGRMQQQITWRTREQVARFFDGTDLVAPGLARTGEWRPDPGSPIRTAAWSAVARKR